MSNDNTMNITGEIFWAYLAKPNTSGEFPSNKYQVTLAVDKATAVILKKKINPKQKIKEVDGKYHIQLKSMLKPIVKLANKTDAPLEVVEKIGNGTTAIVKINFYTVKKEVYAGLNAVLLKKIVEYNNDPFSDVEVEVDSEDLDVPFDSEGASADEEDLI